MANWTENFKLKLFNKPMTFDQAKRKMKKLSNGNYHSLKHQSIIYSDNHIETEFYVYINDYGMATGATWEEAIEKMENQLNGNPSPVISAQEPK